ncbi:MAG TPA: hypothetical protein VGC16_08825 [Rhizomicrobium sp.]
MRATAALAASALVLGTVSGWAFPAPGLDTPAPTQHQIDSRFADAQPQPYAMNYSDEAAQSLGVHDGKWEAFDTRSTDPLVPSFKGGVDNGAAMIKLQWTPN